VFTFAVDVLDSPVCSSLWIVFELCTIWNIVDSTVTKKFLNGYERKNQSCTVVQFLNTCHQVGKDASVYLGIMWNNNDIVVE